MDKTTYYTSLALGLLFTLLSIASLIGAIVGAAHQLIFTLICAPLALVLLDEAAKEKKKDSSNNEIL